MCLCGFSLVFGTANTAHKGVLKITRVMCIFCRREWDNFWGWWEMEKGRSFRRWEAKDMNLNGLWGSPTHWVLSLKSWYWKSRKSTKKSVTGRNIGFFSPMLYNPSGSLDKKMYLFDKKSYGMLILFMANRWGKSGNSDRLYFLGLQNHYGPWLQPWN